MVYAFCYLLSFAAGAGFWAWLLSRRKDRWPEVTEWGESTAQWSEVDWEWYHRRFGYGWPDEGR
jgi:hypothetical protein